MRNKQTLLGLLVLTINFTFAQIEYPETKKIPVTNTYHGVDVIDEYQWMEDNTDPILQNWIEAENKTSIKYLKKVSATYSTTRILENLEDYNLNFSNYNTGIEMEKEVHFRLQYTGKDTEPSIYYSEGNTNRFSYEKLISPKSISRDDKIKFSGMYPSGDSRFLAYTYNRNGSDWKEIKIVGVKNKHFFKETLVDILTPQITWYGQGFYYVRNNKTGNNSHKGLPELMYHKLGTEQFEDVKIVGTSQRAESIQIYGLPDQSMFFLKRANAATKKNSYFFLKPNNMVKNFKVLFFNIKYDMNFVKFENDTVFASTRVNHKKHILKFPLNSPKQWTILNPSYDGAVMTDYDFSEDKLVTSYLSNKASFLVITDFTGKVLGDVNIPEGLSVSDLNYVNETKEFFFKVSSYTIPPVYCQLNLLDYEYKYLGRTEVKFDASKYKFIQKTYTSHDGTQIPIFIVYKNEFREDGNTPFLLETYGGYGTVSQPSFNAGVIYFIEKGGAYAYAHVRGGGAHGYDWAMAGRNLNKKNGILDFNYAAKYLIDEGLTKPKNIGIMGGSHGGMIAAAAMLNKPEYYGAAIIRMGALDILRKELTANGAEQINIEEYGTVEKEDEFLNMLSYSPFHNIESEINYPSTLIITGTDDTRVAPWQSYKFTGKLQSGTNQVNPILLWTQEQSGHFGASSYYGKKEQNSFIYNFLLHELEKQHIEKGAL